jgi:hypothetical protein
MAYVRHFANIDNVKTATFHNIESTGFRVNYETTDGISGQAFITFNTPLTRREDIRPVLEEMAKEAEEALGLVSIPSPTSCHSCHSYHFFTLISSRVPW